MLDRKNDRWLSVADATAAKIFDQETGDVIDSLTQKKHSIAEAEELQLVRVHVTESRDEKPEVNKTFNIRGVVDTRTGRVLEPDEAERRGVIDMSRDEFYNTLSGERTTLVEALKSGHIVSDG